MWSRKEPVRVGLPAEGRLHPAQTPVPRAPGGFLEVRYLMCSRMEVRMPTEGSENPSSPNKSSSPKGLGHMTSRRESSAP